MKTPFKSVALIACLAIYSLPASAGFFGPSTKLLSNEALAQKLQSQPLVIDISGGALDVRSKAAAVGGFLLVSCPPSE
jgi:hypothetical protein